MKNIRKRKSKRGRPPVHGGYSLISKDELLRNQPHIKTYLQNCRDGLVRDIGGSEDRLSEQQRIMIDRIISKLAVCRLIELYVERNGLFRGDSLISVLGQNYLAFSNAIDRGLIALGLDKKAQEEILTPLELAKEIDRQNEDEKGLKGE